MNSGTQFNNLNLIWSTLASHSKETIRKAVLQDELDIALAGNQHSVSIFIKNRMRDLDIPKREDGVKQGDLSKIGPDA
tara:strand:+ start:792 stop:1025 length:234 start_codon:yes stop_codon:yes gene_type:complete